MDVFGHVRAVAADKNVRFFAEDQVAHFLLVFGEFMLNVDFLPSRVFAAESGNEASERFVLDVLFLVGLVIVIFIFASAAKEEPGFGEL